MYTYIYVYMYICIIYIYIYIYIYILGRTQLERDEGLYYFFTLTNVHIVSYSR